MGQLGSAFTNPNTSAPDPSGFSGSEWAARFMGAGAKGLGQGLQQNQMRPQMGGAPAQVPMPQQPMVNLPQGQGLGPGTGDMGGLPPSKQARNNMFYGYSGGS